MTLAGEVPKVTVRRAEVARHHMEGNLLTFRHGGEANLHKTKDSETSYLNAEGMRVKRQIQDQGATSKKNNQKRSQH
jgi:hypothetical protein